MRIFVPRIDPFAAGYLQAALDSSLLRSPKTPLPDAFDGESIQRAVYGCRDFQKNYEWEIRKSIKRFGVTLPELGYALWTTRNGLTPDYRALGLGTLGVGLQRAAKTLEPVVVREAANGRLRIEEIE